MLSAIKDRIKRRLGVPTIPFMLERIRDRGFFPDVVFDVGAHSGEFAKLCLEMFHPTPKVFCFEPLEGCAAHLRALEQQGQIVYVPTLVGATDERAVVFHEMDTGSSVLSEHHPSGSRTESKKQMLRLDTYIANTGCRPPTLLKIDTQGYELHVLKGLVDNLSSVRLILAEINFIDIHRDVPLLHDVVGWLAARGFLAYELCSLIRRPLDGALWQADLIFCKADDSLRMDKRWG